jgi:hypothetical protein
MIGKKSEDAFKPAADAKTRLMAGPAAIIMKVSGMEGGQLPAKLQVVPKRSMQCLSFSLRHLFQSVQDGGQTEPLVAVVFTHRRRHGRHLQWFFTDQFLIIKSVGENFLTEQGDSTVGEDT